MEPAAIVALLWIVFGGTHVILATRRVRGALAAWCGEGIFTGLYSLVAATEFAGLVVYYAAHRFAGAPGLALGDVPALHWGLMALVVAGIVLMAGGLATYPRLPMARAPATFFPPSFVESP